MCSEFVTTCPVGECTHTCKRKELNAHYMENAVDHIEILLKENKAMKKKGWQKGSG
eukprot:gene12898-16425_t